MSDIASIVEKGDTLATLKALRHKLAETIDSSNSGRDIAALARQLQIVTGQISELEAQQADDPIGTILKERSEQNASGPVRGINMKPIYNMEDDE